MLSILGSLFVIYLLNLIVLTIIFDVYISPGIILVIMVIELIIFIAFPCFKTNSNSSNYKRKNVSKKSNMTAEKFNMFNDLNK